MAYRSGDDPQLLSDLRTALKGWRRPTLGDAALANGLADVGRRQAADRWLIRSKALRQTIIAALASMRAGGLDEQAGLLEGRYLRKASVIRLADTYHLSERSIYHRLNEAHMALAHALWAQEQGAAEGSVDSALASGSAPSLPRARHLPPRTYARLFGVDEVLAQLLGYLEDRDRHWVISLDSMAGLGKTALAREAAGQLAASDRFAEIAWVVVNPEFYSSRGSRGLDLPTLTCGQMLDAIASQLFGLDLEPLDLPAKRDRVRELLRGRSYLIVLDNLETVMDCGTLVDWLGEMANPSKFLLTSRHWLMADVGLSVILLNQLSGSESLALLRHEAQLRGLPEVANATDSALNPILAVTGGNPLAIKLVVGQLVSLPLSRVLTALKTVQPDRDAFYRYLYRVSWDLVSAAAQELLRSMAQLPAGRGNWEDLSAGSGLSGDDLASAIEGLITYSLLQASGFEEKSYCLHPLTVHFAISQTVRKTGAREAGGRADQVLDETRFAPDLQDSASLEGDYET